MGSIRQAVSYITVGAISFWLPDILLNALTIDSLIAMTTLPILGFILAYLIAGHLTRSRSGPSLAFFMILGVWLSGSTAMMISASFSGGGFVTPLADTFGVIALGLLPPYTMIMATYDGSLIGLLLASFLALGAHLQFEIDRWVLPPNVRDRLKRWHGNRAI